MELIDKSALVAEIKKLINLYKTCQVHSSYEEGLKEGRLIGYEDALCKINTLETKEVDLEKEIKDTCRGYRINESHEQELGKRDIENIAQYFFELGLKARKESEL